MYGIPTKDVPKLVYRCAPVALQFSREDAEVKVGPVSHKKVLAALEAERQETLYGNEMQLWLGARGFNLPDERFQMDYTRRYQQEMQPDHEKTEQGKEVLKAKDLFDRAEKLSWPEVNLAERRINYFAAKKGFWKRGLFTELPSETPQHTYDFSSYLKALSKCKIFKKPLVVSYRKRNKFKLVSPASIVLEARQACYADFDMDRVMELTDSDSAMAIRVYKAAGREKTLAKLKRWNGGVSFDCLRAFAEFYFNAADKQYCMVLCRSETNPKDDAKVVVRLEMVYLKKEKETWKLTSVRGSVFERMWEDMGLMNQNLSFEDYARKLSDAGNTPGAFKQSLRTLLLSKPDVENLSTNPNR